MPPCCHLTRRQLLGWASLVASTPLLSTLNDDERAYGATAPGQLLPHNLELVTLTEGSVVLTWFTGDPTRPDAMGRAAPVPADTVVRLGTSPARLRTVHADERRTPYHHAEITGLEPGQTYYYRALSDGIPAAPAVFALGNPVGTSGPRSLGAGPFVFRTPQPPRGRHLFTIALTNDLHVGETVAGLAGSVGGIGLPPGVEQRPGEPPYTQVMAEALGRAARERGSDLMLVAGDITSEARPPEVRQAKDYLDAFGRLGRDYLVVRGNHDRPHGGEEWESCSPAPENEHDCFRDDFFPGGGPTWFAREAYGMRIVGLDTYDKLGDGGDSGGLSPEQFAFLRAELRENPDQPTLVFGHHPPTVEETLTTIPPVVFDLAQGQARALERIYGDAPGVFLHHCAHTHRNKRSRARNAPGVVFQEVSATKEYPGGFHLLRVHSGGYALNFYRFPDRPALEWTERSRQEFLGGYPYYTFGTIADRNHVAARDFSGLRSRRDPPRSQDDDLDDPDERSLPATGATRAAAVAGVATMAAAAAAEVWLSKMRRG